MPADFGDAAEFLADARALEAAGAEMIGVEGDDEAILGALAAVTHRVRLRVSTARGSDVVQRLSRGRMVTGADDERWAAVDLPPDRDSWAEMMREQEAAGMHGVVVRWDPRLIDLLRNPEPEDRSDLLMSTG